MATMAVARILIAQERPKEAVSLLERLIGAATAGGQTSRMIEILVLQALAHEAQDNIPLALVPLERALTLAKPEGYVRIFVDEGPPMAHLLYKALSRGITPDYVSRLLAVFPVSVTEQTGKPNTPTFECDLIEPLSERELEVLRLIADGLTNQEIAARLYLSLNTVKVHARNIYGKLGVRNRTRAVAKAKVLGILPSA
jgi:LuxR family maltose regulon positive regulatory protein